MKAAEHPKLEVLALIPARGGSKSIPRKNLRDLAGKPLIAHSIAHALESRLVTRVIVTTDDEQIADIAKQYGAEAPFRRPEEISGDFALDVEYHLHALNWLRDYEGYIPDLVVNLRPPHPIRRCETIDRAISTFSESTADSLRSVRLAELSPYKMWTIDERNLLTPVSSVPGVREHYNLPRQQLPIVYWQDGYIDITRPSVVLEKNSTTGEIIMPFIIEEECIDIDYEDEIAQAEALLTKSPTPNVPKAKTVRHPS